MKTKILEALFSGSQLVRGLSENRYCVQRIPAHGFEALDSASYKLKERSQLKVEFMV